MPTINNFNALPKTTGTEIAPPKSADWTNLLSNMHLALSNLMPTSDFPNPPPTNEGETNHLTDSANSTNNTPSLNLTSGAPEPILPEPLSADAATRSDSANAAPYTYAPPTIDQWAENAIDESSPQTIDSWANKSAYDAIHTPELKVLFVNADGTPLKNAAPDALEQVQTRLNDYGIEVDLQTVGQIEIPQGEMPPEDITFSCSLEDERVAYGADIVVYTSTSTNDYPGLVGQAVLSGDYLFVKDVNDIPVLAHEIGHTLGLDHDEAEISGHKTLMNPEAQDGIYLDQNEITNLRIGIEKSD